MKFKSDLVLLFAESFKRWGQKSPKFFRVWQVINFILLSLSGLPLILAKFNIILTGPKLDIVLWVVGFSAAYGIAMNSLTVSQPADLPFTEKKQIQEAIKNEEIINNTLK